MTIKNKTKRNTIYSVENLPGYPGYRTRPGRTGYDPIDTNLERAHMQGVFYRNLFTFNLKTRDIFHLSLMLFFGITTSLLMSFFLYGLITSPKYGEHDLLFYFVFAYAYLLIGFVLLVGVALLINFFINLAIIFGFNKNKTSRKKIKEKKLPKRRKDFR